VPVISATVAKCNPYFAKDRAALQTQLDMHNLQIINPDSAIRLSHWLATITIFNTTALPIRLKSFICPGVA